MAALNEIPRLVFLFSGHMIDKPDRKLPRFPPECESSIAAAIDAALTELGAGPADLGITQGACGGDLLFSEAMLKRGAALELHLPLPEQTFVVRSVDFRKASSAVPDRWRERFHAVRQQRSVRTTVMPADSESEESDSVFERCNLWMLERAISFGATNVRFICVWNGDGGDGPGGTDHMRKAVKQIGGAECWIDTRKLCQQR